MRAAFEAWAQRDGHIVRRREDKPEEYLVFETQRRWVIWQAALEHGKQDPAEAGAKKAGKSVAAPRKSAAVAQSLSADEAEVRNRVLNEVLDAFTGIDDTAGVEGILKVIQGLKQKPKPAAARSKASA